MSKLQDYATTGRDASVATASTGPGYDPDRLHVFEAIYRGKLAEAAQKYPGLYGGDLVKAADRVMDTIRTKGLRAVNINGYSFKWTAKVLGLKPTYKALIPYLQGK